LPLPGHSITLAVLAATHRNEINVSRRPLGIAIILLGAGLLAGNITAATIEMHPEREAYFGETHVHTGWSFDAYIAGNYLTGPADAYDYAKGRPINTPLDWMGVTDHSEYAGVVRLANDPTSSISTLPFAKELIVRKPEDIERINLWLAKSMIDRKPIAALVSPAVTGSVWKSNNAAADAANEPGKFTAFCAYEWTSTPRDSNLHRTVFFRDCAKVPDAPFSSFDSQAPEDLWDWMDAQRNKGNELLAISHSANLSNGAMYPTDVDFKGRPIDKAWAESRDRNERLTEIKQINGQSETHPVLSPTDTFANYEIMTYRPGDLVPTIPGSYVRQALTDGFGLRAKLDINPYKMGFVGGADSDDTGVPYRQDDYFGSHARADGEIKGRIEGTSIGGLDTRFENPAGLTGVWAEQNTRASLFDAMQRRETFATSGPHIKVRLFGGWNFTTDDDGKKDWIKSAYANGVPMGSDLPAPKNAARAKPKFVVWAVKDPTSGNLDRIQVVKGWAKNGQTFEKIYDVVWSGERRPDRLTGEVPAIGSTVDSEKATYTNTIGSNELKTVWADPDFEPGVDAYYYARVLEIPTPRWTTIQAKKLGIALPDVVPATVQERAWSSPIWFTPTDAGRKSAPAGTTVAALKAQGAVALTDVQLTDLIVGKSVWLHNNVTGGVFQADFDKAGQRLMRSVTRGRLPEQSEIVAALGAPTAYSIDKGTIVTRFGNAPCQMTIYKSGDKYLAARSNEFGFVNYEVIPPPAAMNAPDARAE
jgi:hypothetical protein